MGAPKGAKASTSKGKGKGLSKALGKSAGKGKGKATDTAGKGAKGSGKWVVVKPMVLVTGASGYVAQHVIQVLLQRHYKVRGTVRNLNDQEKVGPLNKLFPKLELVEADLLGGSEAFEKAMEGCKYVMHTASPFIVSAVVNPQTELIDPALKGTTNVMEAAVKSQITRVVVTSSVAAIGPPQPWIADPSQADADKVFTEEDWNTTSTLEDGPYRLSKRLAEEKGWEIAKASDSTSMVSVCPVFVIGPMLTDRCDAESVKFIKAMLDGTTKEAGCGGFPMGLVDVRDVALAHVAAMETEEAGGSRFMVCSERGYSKIELAGMIRDRFKAYPIPTEGPTPAYIPKYSAEQAKKVLKFRPRKIEASMRDMASAAIRLGIVEKKVVLKPVKFGDVVKIDPESKGLDLVVKVVSIGKEEELKTGKKVKDIVVGDNTGIVTLSLSEDEIAVAQVGKTIEVRNASTKMVKGYIRVIVGKWGKITPHEGDKDVTPKMEKDMSATEYELVK